MYIALELMACCRPALSTTEVARRKYASDEKPPSLVDLS